jgi:hypothetical protein
MDVGDARAEMPGAQCAQNCDMTFGSRQHQRSGVVVRARPISRHCVSCALWLGQALHHVHLLRDISTLIQYQKRF